MVRPTRATAGGTPIKTRYSESRRKRARRDEPEDDEEEIPETSPIPSDSPYISEDNSEEETKESSTPDSDALDDSDFEVRAAGRSSSSKKKNRQDVRKQGTKRSPRNTKTQAKAKAKASTTSSAGSPAKKRASKRKRDDAKESDEEAEEYTIVGEIVQAPKEGRVPPGQISQNTLNFLGELGNPECNDRTWFKLHDPVYRLAEKEWVDFIETTIPMVIAVDDQIPFLPPKDLIHRIYRDVRFSNDKTPYKQNFSASFSRSGRKGIFAGYHISIRSNGGLIAAGVWQPGKNELATIRSHILHDAAQLRDIISSPAFVELFGPAKPHEKKIRQNVFGQDDELKTAPKGIDKHHSDIDLLKLRTIAVSRQFSKSDVLNPAFNEKICEIIEVVRPFVHRLNDMMTIAAPNAEQEDEE